MINVMDTLMINFLLFTVDFVRDIVCNTAF